MKQLMRIMVALGFRFAAPLLALGVVLFWYFWYAGGGSAGPLLLDDFCLSLRPGTPVETARQSAKNQGFSIVMEQGDRFTAEFGMAFIQKHRCDVTFADGKVTGSRSYPVD